MKPSKSALDFSSTPIPAEIKPLRAEVDAVEGEIRLVDFPFKHPLLAASNAEVESRQAEHEFRLQSLRETYGSHPVLEPILSTFRDAAALELGGPTVLNRVDADPKSVPADLIESARRTERARQLWLRAADERSEAQAQIRLDLEGRLQAAQSRLAAAEQADLVDCLERFLDREGLTDFDLAWFDRIEPALHQRHGWDGGRLQKLAQDVLKRRAESRDYYRRVGIVVLSAVMILGIATFVGIVFSFAWGVVVAIALALVGGGTLVWDSGQLQEVAQNVVVLTSRLGVVVATVMILGIATCAGFVWDAATREEIRTLPGHTGSVNSVAFSPDGKRIVSGSRDKTLKVWDAATGEEIRTLRGHTDLVWSVAFSPDGKRIVSGSGDHTLKVWDAATGEDIRTLRGHTDLVNSVAFSPDGKRIVSGSDDKTLKVWDAATGEEIRTLPGHTCVAFSPDGKRIVSGSFDKTLKVWDSGD